MTLLSEEKCIVWSSKMILYVKLKDQQIRIDVSVINGSSRHSVSQFDLKKLRRVIVFVHWNRTLYRDVFLFYNSVGDDLNSRKHLYRKGQSLGSQNTMFIDDSKNFLDNLS